jgi:hypothetical protein
MRNGVKEGLHPRELRARKIDECRFIGAEATAHRSCYRAQFEATPLETLDAAAKVDIGPAAPAQDQNPMIEDVGGGLTGGFGERIRIAAAHDDGKRADIIASSFRTEAAGRSLVFGK